MAAPKHIYIVFVAFMLFSHYVASKPAKCFEKSLLSCAARRCYHPVDIFRFAHTHPHHTPFLLVSTLVCVSNFIIANSVCALKGFAPSIHHLKILLASYKLLIKISTLGNISIKAFNFSTSLHNTK